MTDKREEPSKVRAGRAVGESDATLNVSEERKAEIEEDTRPGSAIGGHEPGQSPTAERATMDDERRG
ncbi:MAG TPA: hypothetical protein VIL85_20855 [Thermomicrobiales bacterium]|jgi:hypothetical protein